MIVILDTSIIIHALLHPSEVNYLNLIEESDTHAPDIVIAELGNVFWKYIQFKNMDIKTAKDKFQSGLDLISQIIPAELIRNSSLELAVKHQISFYDSLYLAVAIELKSPLLTLDKKLQRIAADYKLNYHF